jgi:gas vesicle protein
VEGNLELCGLILLWGGNIPMTRKGATFVSISAIGLAVIVMGATTAMAGSGGNGVPDRLTQLEQTVSTLQTTVTSQGNQISSLQQSLSQVQTQGQGLQSDITSLKQGLDDLKSQTNTENQNVQGEINNLQNTVSSLQTQVQNLQTSGQSGGGNTDAFKLVWPFSGQVFSFQGVQIQFNHLVSLTGSDLIHAKITDQNGTVISILGTEIADNGYAINFWSPQIVVGNTYTFALPANAVQDTNGSFYNQPITLQFSTSVTGAVQ